MADAQSRAPQERLLAVAASQFRLNGYAGTTTRELASELGIQKASLYHYMDGKEDLLFKICVESLNRIIEDVTEALGLASPDNAIPSLIAAHLESAIANRDMHATMLMEIRALSGNNRSEVVALRDRYQAIISKAIHEGQEAGEIRDDIETRILTLGLLNLLNWTIFWYDPTKTVSVDELASDFTAIFLDGVALPSVDHSGLIEELAS